MVSYTYFSQSYKDQNKVSKKLLLDKLVKVVKMAKSYF